MILDALDAASWYQPSQCVTKITHGDYVGWPWLDFRVCLFVCLQHNSKTNDPQVFKLDTVQGMTLGYPTSNMVFG